MVLHHHNGVLAVGHMQDVGAGKVSMAQCTVDEMRFDQSLVALKPAHCCTQALGTGLPVVELGLGPGDQANATRRPGSGPLGYQPLLLLLARPCATAA